MQSFQELRERFLSYLEEHKFDSTPQGLYHPVNYILSIGGKRIRPVLLLMGYQLFQDELEPSLAAAYAVEVFHNFTLLHDDIMDEADIRRGQATVHKKYNLNTGILSGDAMMIKAYQYLASYKEPVLVVRLFEIFNKFALEICEGQQWDMEFENRDDVEIEEYMKMIEFKTAVLLAGSLQIGALIAGSSEEDANHLYEFGRNIGMAFQLQDDMLDTFGDQDSFGKKIGGDILQNKKTYLYLRALELASEDQKELLNKYYTGSDFSPEEKIETVKGIFKSLNVLEYAEQVKATYTDLAYSHLAAVKIDQTRKENLESLSKEMLARSN